MFCLIYLYTQFHLWPYFAAGGMNCTTCRWRGWAAASTNRKIVPVRSCSKAELERRHRLVSNSLGSLWCFLVDYIKCVSCQAAAGALSGCSSFTVGSLLPGCWVGCFSLGEDLCCRNEYLSILASHSDSLQVITHLEVNNLCLLIIIMCLSGSLIVL